MIRATGLMAAAASVTDLHSHHLPPSGAQAPVESTATSDGACVPPCELCNRAPSTVKRLRNYENLRFNTHPGLEDLTDASQDPISYGDTQAAQGPQRACSDGMREAIARPGTHSVT
jgi:hypothetical protein